MKKLIYILLILPILANAQDGDPCYSINDYNLLTELNNPQIEINLVSGWNMIGYPCTQEIIVSDAFSSIVNEITIVKNNNGSVYMPEFSFNGIGFLEGGQGYQIKMTDFVLGFTFCQSVQFPTIEGCTDCEASNFSKLATTNDGSCIYDSDGDGIPDSEEVVGCQDETACNYNELATDIGECSFAQLNYDCEGNISQYEVGMVAEGGIVFYYNSIGDYGLVATLEDLEGTYWWAACYYTSISGADEQSIGTGYQNTLDIVAGCSHTPIAASEALAYEVEGYIESYSDWYLPSRNELLEMYNTIGFGGPEGNIGNFNNSGYWSSSEDWESEGYWSSSEDWESEITNFAFNVQFNNGGSYSSIKNESFRVRPIRAFGNWTMGCMDSLACNYNTEANMADGSCEYPEQGYDCQGNITIGAYIDGGIVFYVDDTGQSGLIAVDYGNNEGPEHQWGCEGILVDGADNSFLGGGYQNSIDILEFGCDDISNNPDYYIAAEVANYYSPLNNWYLPSIDELTLIYNNIGGGAENPIISLEGTYWSSTEHSADNAWFLDFYDDNWDAIDGYSIDNSNKVTAYRVLPISNFGNSIIGCIDSTACNYNPDANIADESCEYPEQGFDCNGNLTAEIGDLMGGGYLFYVDETGQHGLIAAPEDVSGKYQWGCQGTNLNGAEWAGIGTGYQNTLDIVSDCQTTPIAASVALAYESSGYNDWFLPSQYELQMMFSSLGPSSPFGNIGDFQTTGANNNIYWSSTEYIATGQYSTWYAMFGGIYPNGTTTFQYNSKSDQIRVRPIRSF